MAALSFLGCAVFAAAGALTASRKQLDPVGFILIAAVTAFGGGTTRDLLLGAPVFWLQEPGLLALTAGVAVLVFFAAHLAERRFLWLLWADAIGLAIFAVLGAEAALREGASPGIAVLMGIITATFGGIIRDVICDELPLILRREIYATAAAIGAGLYVGLESVGLDRTIAISAGMLLALLIRAAAILRAWSLPAYRARAGRDYPDRGPPP
ncbi:trimeric intracellular cation channel family protein [Roseomonas hellenica]|uniref:Trimeric intracellular cation channel family protein n=1 Tax=Plastoroseomonas hellenica TaxID=2687306 RepID=A0ABS5F3W5_9PROT|nr:trimeric intracellular cation channel family protein [Plastoroseomonas hellenica]